MALVHPWQRRVSRGVQFTPAWCRKTWQVRQSLLLRLATSTPHPDRATPRSRHRLSLSREPAGRAEAGRGSSNDDTITVNTCTIRSHLVLTGSGATSAGAPGDNDALKAG